MVQLLDRPIEATVFAGGIRYSTSQPAPTQWVAVAVTSVAHREEAVRHPRLVVGTGRTEAAAVAALRQRIREIARE